MTSRSESANIFRLSVSDCESGLETDKNSVNFSNSAKKSLTNYESCGMITEFKRERERHLYLVN